MVQGTSQSSLDSPLQPEITAELTICVPSHSLIFAAQIRVEWGLGTSEASHG